MNGLGADRRQTGDEQKEPGGTDQSEVPELSLVEDPNNRCTDTWFERILSKGIPEILWKLK